LIVKTYLCVYLGSAILAVALTPLVINVARRIGAVDRPGVRAVHRRPTPRIGGLAIYVAAVLLILPTLCLNNAVGVACRGMRTQLTVLFGSATFVLAVGLVDDLKGLAARVKLLTEVIAAGMLCAGGVRIDSVAVTPGLVLDLGGWGYLLTLLRVVGITNAVNLSDGLDGLAAGISAMACGVIAICAVHGGHVVLAVLMLALLGSLSGFLLFNFNPAKVFLGDSGSLFLGFTIASSSVMCVAKSTALVGLTLPALALGIPIFDTACAMLRRFLERRSLFSPDRSHFHHRLLDLGLQQRQAVLLIYLVTLSASGLGLFMLLRDDLGSLVVFGGVLVLVVLLFRVVGMICLPEILGKLQRRRACSRQERQTRSTFEHLQLRFRQVRDARDWWQAVCQAAGQLDFAWLSVRIVNVNATTNTLVWRGRCPPRYSMHIVVMNLPVVIDDRQMEFEIAVPINESLESATHRAALFGRLMDEGAARDPASTVHMQDMKPSSVTCRDGKTADEREDAAVPIVGSVATPV